MGSARIAAKFVGLVLIGVLSGNAEASAVEGRANPLLQPMPIGDCDDTNPNVRPGALEIPFNGIDENCNGLADEATDGTPSNDGADIDGDGISVESGDCNDHNSAVRPGIAEVPGDLIDNNCNTIADEDAQGNPSLDTIDHDSDGLPISNDRIFYGDFEI